MKTKILLIVNFIVILFINSSCEDYLEVLPENEQVRDEYWTSKEEVESVLASGYVYFRRSVKNLIEWGELRGGCIYDRYGNDLQDFQISPDDEGICSWAPFYKVINMANSVIANAETVLKIDETFEEPVMKSYLTEAYFLRALSYFYLVRNWRDVPLVLEPYENDKASYQKTQSSESEIIAQIKEDIKMALETGAAKTTYDEDWETKGRATKWALHALMADVCLWSEDYTSAIIHCNEILDATSAFRPVFIQDPSKWYEIFYPGNSNESIFEIQYDQAQFDQVNNLATIFGASSPEYVYTTRMLQNFIEETNETGVDNAVRTLYGGFIPNTSDREAYNDATLGYVWKYSGIGMQDQVRNTTDEQDPNFIIYRMADILLMKAEALILNSNDRESWQSAVDLVNMVRTRSNLSPIEPVLEEVSEKDLLKYVLDERKMEFAAEGKRWYDLLRFGKRNNFKYRDEFLISEVVNYNETANPSWIRSVLRDDNALYLPVWSNELLNNELLVQNPYYDIVN